MSGRRTPASQACWNDSGQPQSSCRSLVVLRAKRRGRTLTGGLCRCRKWSHAGFLLVFGFCCSVNLASVASAAVSSLKLKEPMTEFLQRMMQPLVAS